MRKWNYRTLVNSRVCFLGSRLKRGEIRESTIYKLNLLEKREKKITRQKVKWPASQYLTGLPLFIYRSNRKILCSRQCSVLLLSLPPIPWQLRSLHLIFFNLAANKRIQKLKFKNVFLFRLRQWQVVQLANSECQNRDIKNPSPTKPTQPTHRAPTHMCASHMGRRETRNETMELAVCSWTLICFIFFLSLRHSRKEEEVSTS